MAARYDIISPRARKGADGQVKTNWVRIGAAFPRDRGGFSLKLDALPLPDADGRVRLAHERAAPGRPWPA